MTRVPFVSIRYLEPVTVRAAPRNVIEIIQSPPLASRLSLRKQSDLASRVPEQNRTGDRSVAHSRQQAGHRLPRIGRVEEQRFTARRELNRFGRRRGRDAVTIADEAVVRTTA